jgi:hypothetical protein
MIRIYQQDKKWLMDTTTTVNGRELPITVTPTRQEIELWQWKEAIVEACVVNHLSWDEIDPRKSLANLIGWETTVALDPAVSKPAQDLIDRGWAETRHFYTHTTRCTSCNACRDDEDRQRGDNGIYG